MAKLRWKLRDYLQQNGIPTLQLAKAMGDGRVATLYRLTSPDPERTPSRIDFHTLEAIVTALRQLTGNRVSVCDLLEYEEGR
jgi:predicted ArsR family transcriptional regulator